ncbi:hypothetical protein [Streptococcus oricebi]|uniref:Bacteriocin n=1 Tax=Streptococcus oricebi TaxID=1547447 RepID=A0ABS5B3H5_9STRE|nr:hypothetical protein [Streptococcus oricebi]MBP2623386.1 hypothetical protein [Streptococcus oricebi]
MKKIKIFTLLLFSLIIFTAISTSNVKAGTDPYWERQKQMTHMVYGPFFAYRTGSALNHWGAKIPGTFEYRVRNAVLYKYGTINAGKTYRVRWYQKISPRGKFGMGQSGQAVGFYCEN